MSSSPERLESLAKVMRRVADEDDVWTPEDLKEVAEIFGLRVKESPPAPVAVTARTMTKSHLLVFLVEHYIMVLPFIFCVVKATEAISGMKFHHFLATNASTIHTWFWIFLYEFGKAWWAFVTVWVK